MQTNVIFQTIPWDMIPDIGLYMDQVITFITRGYEPIYGREATNMVSPSMINNYVKAKLIPKPTGKKYSREQIALMILIVVLKQVASMEEIRSMITLQEGMTVQTLYERFCNRTEMITRAMTEWMTAKEFNTPLDYAIISSSYRAMFVQLLNKED